MKESFEKNHQESILEVSIDEKHYKHLALKLFEDNKDKILNRPTSESIEDVLKEFDSEALNKFWGHGATRGDINERIAAAISLLDNKVMIGSCAPLAGSGYNNAYIDGDFFVISHKDHKLVGRDVKEKQYVKLKETTGKIRTGIKIHPGVFVCNNRFDALVEPLRKLFPDEKILHAGELANYIKEQESEFKE